MFFSFYSFNGCSPCKKRKPCRNRNRPTLFNNYINTDVSFERNANDSENFGTLPYKLGVSPFRCINGLTDF